MVANPRFLNYASICPKIASETVQHLNYHILRAGDQIPNRSREKKFLVGENFFLDLFRPQTPPELFLSTNMMFLEDIEKKKKNLRLFFSAISGHPCGILDFVSRKHVEGSFCGKTTRHRTTLEKPP